MEKDLRSRGGKGLSRRQFVKTVGLGSLALSGMSFNPLNAWGADGKKFIWGGPSEFQSMDPHAIYDVTSENLRLNLYDHLYRYLDNPPKIQPWLAESYTVSSNELKWTFKLRKGAKFHNGDEVTAEAVKYSIEEALDFIESDELIDVTPKNIRLRKRWLSKVDRVRYQRDLKAKTGE